MGTLCGSATNALLSRCYSGHHKATDQQDDLGTLGRDMEKEMWTAGFRHSWRKMELAAQDTAGWRRVVCGLCFSGSKKAQVK